MLIVGVPQETDPLLGNKTSKPAKVLMACLTKYATNENLVGIGGRPRDHLVQRSIYSSNLCTLQHVAISLDNCNTAYRHSMAPGLQQFGRIFVWESKKIDTLISLVGRSTSCFRNQFIKKQFWTEKDICRAFTPGFLQTQDHFECIFFKLASAEGFRSVEVLQRLPWGWNEFWSHTKQLIREFAWIICLANKKEKFGNHSLSASYIHLVCKVASAGFRITMALNVSSYPCGKKIYVSRILAFNR